MKNFVVITAIGALLSGCASIGDVNGIPVGNNPEAQSIDKKGYCAENPAICIIGGAVAIGVLRKLINDSNSSDSNTDIPINPTGPIFT